jgi:hypothetical protein
MTCLDEDALLRLHLDDGNDAERAHAAACVTCARALAAVATDLARLGTALGDGTPALRPRRRPGRLVLAPIAVAAAFLLAVALGRPPTTPPPSDDADTLVLLDELMGAVATDDGLDMLLGTPDETATAAARSTCAWGEPFLGMGCDEPPVTLVAWR